MSDIQFIRWAIGTVPTAIDMWLAVIAICIAFDRKIPVLVWVMLALEVVARVIIKAKGGSL